jgi:putative membrane protein
MAPQCGLGAAKIQTLKGTDMTRAATLLSCLLIATPVIATPVLAQSLGEKTGINSTLGISPSAADFARQVAISDLFEISSSKLAQTKGTEAEKKFATMMIEEHSKTSSELKRLVATGTANVDLPAQLDSAHQKKLDKLSRLSGAEFSEAYVADQITAHKDAVALFERFAKGGDQSDLKQWAGNTLPKLQQHLQMAEQLDEQRRNAPTVGSSTK